MKNVILMITLLGATWMMSACSIAPTSSDLVSHKTDAQENTKKYGSSLSAFSITEKKSDFCPTDKKVEAEKNWKHLISYANGCISKNQWSMVEMIGEKLSQIEPDAPWGAYYLSVVSEKNGHTERALWMIDLALKKADGIGLLRYQKGRILWERQFYKEAITEIEKSISLDNGITDAHVFLGQVYLRELDFKKAMGHFQTALGSDSSNYSALFGLANCYIELEQTQEALGMLDRAISRYPRSVDLRLQEIYVYENLLKKPEAALEKYKKLQVLVSSRKVDGMVPFDLAEKIKTLEVEAQKLRQIASQKTEQTQKK
jgi:tetratricopeptide (TPR) repeat protein